MREPQGPEEAAGVEALLIDKKSLDNLSNKIPALNPNKPKNAARLQAGKKVLDQHAGNVDDLRAPQGPSNGVESDEGHGE